jgi:hypothetical protein
MVIIDKWEEKRKARTENMEVEQTAELLQVILGRTNRILSSDTTRTAKKTTNKEKTQIHGQ